MTYRPLPDLGGGLPRPTGRDVARVALLAFFALALSYFTGAAEIGRLATVLIHLGSAMLLLGEGIRILHSGVVPESDTSSGYVERRKLPAVPPRLTGLFALLMALVVMALVLPELGSLAGAGA